MSLAPDVASALIDGNVLLQAEPGAGKSTALPLALVQDGQYAGKILLLEPRRLAARMVASRLASHLGEQVGQRVGLRLTVAQLGVRELNYGFSAHYRLILKCWSASLLNCLTRLIIWIGTIINNVY